LRTERGGDPPIRWGMGSELREERREAGFAYMEETRRKRGEELWRVHPGDSRCLQENGGRPLVLLSCE